MPSTNDSLEETEFQMQQGSISKIFMITKMKSITFEISLFLFFMQTFFSQQIFVLISFFRVFSNFFLGENQVVSIRHAAVFKEDIFLFAVETSSSTTMFIQLLNYGSSQ